jgi:hypothetical protein
VALAEVSALYVAILLLRKRRAATHSRRVSRGLRVGAGACGVVRNELERATPFAAVIVRQ